MKLSEIMTTSDWAACLDAADGNVEKAKVYAAIGWHETHWGRLGWGQYGYHLGVGAYGSGQSQYKGVANQLSWTAERLGTQDSYSLADLQWYGREIQKPTQDDGTNTGNAWGQSVYSIYKSLVVDLDVPATDGPTLPSDIGKAYASLPQWGQSLVIGIVGLLGALMLLPGGGDRNG